MAFSEKLGLELGHMNQLGQLRKLPQLFTHDTLNTIVTCRICRGTGLNSVIHGNNTVTLMKCAFCKGRKVFRNRF